MGKSVARRFRAIAVILALWAVPASAQVGVFTDIRLGGVSIRISAGTGSPEGVLVGSPGDEYFCASSCSSVYQWVKATGTNTNTGWIAAGGGSGTVTGSSLTDNAVIVGTGGVGVEALASLGTTTTVLHGNASGLPTFGPVALASDVSGDLPLANLAQGSALSVLGVAGNATADNASIAAGTDNQVLRRSGTALAFGAVNLASSNAVTGVLPVANFTTGTPTGSKFVRDDGVLTVPAGGGDVVGPASAVDGHLALFDGTSGKLIKDGGAPGGGGGSFTQLAQIVTSGSQATVDFTSISGSYSALKVVYFSQDTQAGTASVVMRVRINNDSTSGNYTSAQRNGGQNGSGFASTIAAAAGGVMICGNPQAGNTGMTNAGELTLIGYAGTTFHKRILASCGYEDGTTAATVVDFTARWISTAAITRVTFTTDGTAFLDGSTFTLYGLQ